MLFFYYCFDDWLAATTGTEWLGAVPWVVVLLAHFVFAPLAITVKR